MSSTGSAVASSHLRLADGLEEELRKRGVELNAIVRATWEVISVENSGMAPQPDASLQQGRGVALPGSAGAQRFIATLRSGKRECEIAVDVTASTWGMMLAAFNHGALREYGTDRDEVLINIVAGFVRLELSYGGESYSDPMLKPGLTLNEDALEYLTAHRPVKAG